MSGARPFRVYYDSSYRRPKQQWGEVIWPKRQTPEARKKENARIVARERRRLDAIAQREFKHLLKYSPEFAKSFARQQRKEQAIAKAKKIAASQKLKQKVKQKELRLKKLLNQKLKQKVKQKELRLKKLLKEISAQKKLKAKRALRREK